MHKCEPSFTSIATPAIKYCNKCCKSGHSFEECQERKIVCPFCGGDHKSADCKQANDPKCLNCNGQHPAFSCPERSKTPESPKETAPILPQKTPPAKDLPAIMQDMMEEHPGQLPQNPDCPLRMPITENDVEIAIHRGKNTAPGRPDSINRKTMKQLPNTIYPILALLIRMSEIRIFSESVEMCE
ncbi:hypothetical protein JTB14_038005 [Gonioctena quinquepunctata]|nr:hypothetical protein JTB14_038005 [Gonioctena quinquepunctata]